MYIGNTPTTQLHVSALDSFNGDGTTVAFTVSRVVGTEKDLDVTVNGVPQDPNNSYTVNGNVVTFTEAPSVGTGNIIVRFRAYVVTKIVPDDETVTAAMIANNSITGVKIATGTLTGDKIAAATIGSSNLTITGVSAGTYGGTGNTPSLIIDAQGRVTAAINVATTSSGGGTSSAKSIILNAVFGG